MDDFIIPIHTHTHTQNMKEYSFLFYLSIGFKNTEHKVQRMELNLVNSFLPQKMNQMGHLIKLRYNNAFNIYDVCDSKPQN